MRIELTSHHLHSILYTQAICFSTGLHANDDQKPYKYTWASRPGPGRADFGVWIGGVSGVHSGVQIVTVLFCMPNNSNFIFAKHSQHCACMQSCRNARQFTLNGITCVTATYHVLASCDTTPALHVVDGWTVGHRPLLQPVQTFKAE